MDAAKYKSVALKIAVYEKAKPMAEADYSTMGGFLKRLIDEEYERRNGKASKKK
jgi:hypothetical protein|tara:strand:- start:956 stop:1117 length:162 start_codon:yes stop_codon:yes gene_type:complete